MAGENPGSSSPAEPGDTYRPRRSSAQEADVVSEGPTDPEEDGTAGRPRRKVLRWVIIGVALLLVIAVAIGGLYIYRLSSAFDDNRNVLDLDLGDDSADRTNDGVINMLLLGTDSRGEDRDLADVKGEDGERSDTMMFVHIPEDRSGIYVMSIMRDLWVDVPGQGQGRINSALGAGGYPLVVDTVEEMLNTHIDHVAIIDFDGFSELTESLGGVYVDNPRAFSAGNNNPTFYPEGTIRLQGNDALRFVRERKAFPTGDYARVENQQRVVDAIIDRMLSSETMTNPQTVFNVVDGLVPYLTVDDGLDSRTIAGYAMDLRTMDSQDIEMFTIPTGDPAVTTGGSQVLLQDEQMLELLRRSLKNENMDGFLDYVESAEDSADQEGDQEGDQESDEGAAEEADQDAAQGVDQQAAEEAEQGLQQDAEQAPAPEAPIE